MSPIEFAIACREERDGLLSLFSDEKGKSAVAGHLAAFGLTPSQRKHVIAAIEAALTDAFYTLLLALDGSVSLGSYQRSFILTDDGGGVIANGDGRLEAAAWDAFQSDR